MAEPDLSKLSEADLKAVAAGDFSKVSTEGLRALSGATPPKFQHGGFDSTLQGATFGFSDEIGAAKDALFGEGNYSENLRDRALSRAQYERENPGAALSAELAGAAATSLLPGIGVFRAATAPAMAARLGPMAARVVGAAGGGLTSGAITGAGTAPEGERTAGAVRGGATGLVLGPAVAVGMRGVGKVGEVARDVTAGIPVVQRAGQAAALATGQSIDYTRRAYEKLLQAVQRDELTPQEMAVAVRALQGKPETLIERGGSNVLGLADVATKFPGKARTAAGQLIEERMGGQGERITADLSQAFRVQGDPAALAQSFANQRAAAAKPLYEKAYQEGASIADPRISEYMRLPAFQQAYGRARRIAAYDGVELPADPRKLSSFDMRTLDYVKRGLDDVVYSNKVPSPGGLGNTEINKVRDAQKGFLGVLDELVPSYAQARAAWAGPTAMRDALEAGQGIRKMSLDEVRQSLGNMTQAELEQFKIGALAGIRSDMHKAADGRDLVKMVYGSPEKRDILRALVGDDEFARLESQFMRERAIRRTDDKIRGNSSTPERTAGMADLEGATSAALAPVTGGVRGAVDYVLRSGSGVAQPTADALAPMLFSTNRKGQLDTLQRLTDLDRQFRATAAGRGTFTGAGAGSGLGLLQDTGK